ncbi:uncharacterized protein ARB_04677 [Trichophyton benhamiae CBS 112371]|uniref:uncharacterized protein n=1 Tax=Arthroderma benhamiae (strain ATCC MYA-4681 / CBS 112371) TaxID=663331 RepID=UPI0001CB4ABA|nr:uncharacterized protein ARB_04677 [Trichophyton benhamiae CBS 112371]EFE37148.1 hypothetical protein ARB_04677 [Trichophyton benhamiae CBS 112371]
MLLRWHSVIPLFLAMTVAFPNTYRTVVEDLPAIPEGWVQGNPPSPETSVRMNLAVGQQNTRTFEQIVLDISTPGHRNYGKHLSRRDLKGLLRPRRETSNLILSWLEKSASLNGQLWTMETGYILSFQFPKLKGCFKPGFITFMTYKTQESP